MLIIFNILGILISVLLYKKVVASYASIVNHVSIFTVVWLTVIIGSQAFQRDYAPSAETIGIAYIVMFVFLISSSHTSKAFRYPKERIVYNTSKLKLVVFILFILTIISNFGLLFYLYKAGFDFNVWSEIRINREINNLVENEFLYNVFGRSYFLYLPMTILLLKYKKIKKLTFVLIFVTSLLLATTSFTRAPLVQLSVITIVSYTFINRGKVNAAKLSLVGVLLLLVFMFSQSILLGNYINKSTPLEDLQLYLFGGIKAYDGLLHGNYVDLKAENYDVGLYSLDFINYILKKLGLINSYPSYVRNYDQEVRTNVYTFLDALTLDFGILGAALTALIFGWVPKLFYNLFMRSRSLFSLVIYSLLCYYSFMIFMNNEMIRFSFLLIIAEMLLIENLIRTKN